MDIVVAKKNEITKTKKAAIVKTYTCVYCDVYYPIYINKKYPELPENPSKPKQVFTIKDGEVSDHVSTTAAKNDAALQNADCIIEVVGDYSA